MANIDYENKRLLDVVNENDEIIGAKPRAEIHRLGLTHREIHVWFYDENSNVIFQKRGLHRKSAGLLDATVGGHVNQGEDYLTAAIREVKEEIGIEIEPSELELLTRLRGQDPTVDILDPINNFFRNVYICIHPVKSERIQKEVGIPGGGFQKISLGFLKGRENKDLFLPYVYKEELPLIIDFLK